MEDNGKVPAHDYGWGLFVYLFDSRKHKREPIRLSTKVFD